MFGLGLWWGLVRTFRVWLFLPTSHFPLPTSHYVGGQGQMTVGTQTGAPNFNGVCTRGLFCVWFKREREAYARRGAR